MKHELLRSARIALLLFVFLVTFASTTSAQSAWGGGCAPGSGSLDSCIGLVWPTLYADFWVNGPVPDTAFAEVFICVPGGSCTLKGYNYLPPGQSSIYTQDVSGVGSAFTRVKIWDYNTYYLYATIDSPVQYWDESPQNKEQ